MAGLVDKFPHLPGHLTEFKDGGMQLVKEANPPKTESVLLIGTAIDGPIMDPVKLDSETYELIVGKCIDENGMPNGATLPQAFEEAYAGGCRDIRLMRISGSVARTEIEGASTSKVEGKMYEGILGVTGGNSSAQSSFYLQEEASAVLEVQANGITLANTDSVIELKSVVANKFTNGTDIFDMAQCTTVKIVKDTTNVVVLATDDIYKETATGVKVWGTTLSGTYTGYTKVVTKAVDYVLADKTSAEDAFLDNATSVIVEAVANNNVVVKPVIRTKITLNDNVCDSGCFVSVKYTNTSRKTLIENASDLSGVFKANGVVQEFILADNIIPVEQTAKLYFNGVEYNELDKLANSNETIFKIVKFDDNGTEKAKVVINPGTHSKKGFKIEIRAMYKKVTTFTPKIVLESSFGGNIYNGLQVQVETVMHSNLTEKVVKIYKPKSKKSQISEAPLTYSSINYPTFALLSRAINNDLRNSGLVKAIVSSDMEQVAMSMLNAVPTPRNFTGGDDGLNLSKDEIFEKLSGKKDANGKIIEYGAYQLLENYTTDYVVVTGVHADDELLGRYDNFAYELALFCAVSSHRNHITQGFLATSSPVSAGLFDIENHVQKLESYNNVYLMRDLKGEIILDNEQQPIDLGMYIHAFAGGDVVLNNTRLGSYAVNSAAALAGYMSTVAVNSSSTNKVVPYTRGLKIKYSNGQLDRLAANRMITLKYKKEGVVAVVDAMTCARPGSDYERSSSMKAVRILGNEIREVADPFLGEPNTVQQRNALSALIDKRLGLHKENGTIQDYSFNLMANKFDELVGQAKLELSIVPAQELRKITTIISLKPSL